MSYTGIDYGLGRSNIDTETGIRYGVIGQNSINPDCMDDVDYDYGKPTCPECGNDTIDAESDLIPEDTDDWKTARGCSDYACLRCKTFLDSGDCFSDEAMGWSYDSDGYQLSDCLDTDIFVFKSPYYTFAQFCSPCVPGAGNLESTMANGVKTYCLGHDWFDDSRAPYPVFSVADDSEIQP